MGKVQKSSTLVRYILQRREAVVEAAGRKVKTFFYFWQVFQLFSACFLEKTVKSLFFLQIFVDL